MLNSKLLLVALVLFASFQQILGTESPVSLQNLADNVEEDLSVDFHIFDLIFGEANLKKFAQYNDLADVSDSSSGVHRALLKILSESHQFTFDYYEAENEDDSDLDLDQVYNHQHQNQGRDLEITEGDVLDALALLQDLDISAGQAGKRHYLASFISAALDELDNMEKLDDENFEDPFEFEKEIMIMADDEPQTKQGNFFASSPALTWTLIGAMITSLVVLGVIAFKKPEQTEIPEEEAAATRYYQI